MSTYFRTQFAIDSIPNMQFSGLTDGSTWNGFSCPWFEFELEVTVKDLQARTVTLTESVEALTENRSDLMQDLHNERSAHLRTQAQLEAAYGAAKTLSRLLAAAEDKAAK